MERRLRILIKIDIGRLPVEKAALAEIIPESAQITELFQLKKKPKLLPRFPEDRFFLRLPRIDVPADGNIEKVGKVFFTVGPLLIPNPGLPVFPGHDPKVYHPVKEPFPVGAFPGDRAFFLQILRQFHQHFHFERFGQIGIRPILVAAHLALFVVSRCQQDDGDVTDRNVFLYVFAKLISVHPGHHDVADDDIGSMASDQLQCFCAIRGNQYPFEVFTQRFFQEVRQVGIVVYCQNTVWSGVKTVFFL